MITVRLKGLFMAACLVEAVWLLVAQVWGGMALILPCLVCFLGLVVWATIQNMAMPVILFFLPFASLLKIRPGTISFYTIALLLIYLIYTVTGSRNVRIHHLVPALCLVALTLVVKTLYGYEIDNTYILFAITLMLLPFFAVELNGQSGRYDFYWLTLFFVVGIALAAVTAQYLVMFPNIARYIDVNTTLGVIRRSGYYGDPNFYSAHITAALSGVLILFLNGTKKRTLFALILMALLLIYCGLMSVSKSFLLVALCLFLFWVLELLFQKGRVSVKVTLILTLIVTAMFVLSSTIFTDMLGEILARFSDDNNISDFTTGRTELWYRYLVALAEDPLLLLFGKGYTDVLVGGRAAHNTIIQSIFQFGLVGCAFALAWVVFFVRVLLDDAKVRWNTVTQVAILFIGVFGPWMALDYLFFDELFILPVYVCVALRFLSEQSEIRSALPETAAG